MPLAQTIGTRRTIICSTAAFARLVPANVVTLLLLTNLSAATSGTDEAYWKPKQIIRYEEITKNMIRPNTTECPILLLNASVITTDGEYRREPIEPDEARELVVAHGFKSAIGHAATAAAFSEILGIEVPVNRIRAVQAVGQVAIVLQMLGRLPEGHVASLPEMEAIGYDLKKLARTA